METLMLVLLGGSLLTILGLIVICSRLNTKNLQLECTNRLLHREIDEHVAKARNLLANINKSIKELENK